MPFALDRQRGCNYSLNPLGVQFWMVDDTLQVRCFVGQLILEELEGDKLSGPAALIRRFELHLDQIETAALQRLDADDARGEPVSLRKIDFASLVEADRIDRRL